MLETKDLCKTYKPKKGVPVKAIDHISQRFPEKGMVFLLGKSGSGKSTMLNLLGGLDSYDDGEIIIKGISSKNFSQQWFDSYRNTYVGFIFQEYNVLEEFTVGANIALALQLQGKKATDDEINRILHDVDLDGYGNRNPNELSGGQKQRVAIARALVKNPEIIMADEPTGALDSNTGRQVLDTLKKLSENKLVIIVSHDREYAQQYADRIIELADGKVICDVESATTDGSEQTKLVFKDNIIEMPRGYHLTDEDKIRINDYVDNINDNMKISVLSPARTFQQTDESRIILHDSSKFNLIKSKLPIRAASKIGKSTLKHKKVRLVFTVLLSVAAFTLFAFVDTFGSYNNIRSCVDSLIDSEIKSVSVSKSVKIDDGTETFWKQYGNLSEKDLNDITEDTGISVKGVFLPEISPDSMTFTTQFDPTKIISESQDMSGEMYVVNLMTFCGFAEITDDEIKNMGYSIYSGRIPDGSKDEIAISLLACNTFVKAGYKKTEKKPDEILDDPDAVESFLNGDNSFEKISTPEEMIGKTLFLNNTEYTITGIIDTKHDFSRYERLVEDADKKNSLDMIIDGVLWMEFQNNILHSLTGTAMVGKGKLSQIVSAEPKIYSDQYSIISLLSSSNSKIRYYCRRFSKLSDIPDSDIIWFDGKKEVLDDNEVIINFNQISSIEGMIAREKSSSQNGIEITDEYIGQIKKMLYSYGNITALVFSIQQNYGTPPKNIDNIKIVGLLKKDSIYSENEVSVYSDNVTEMVIENSDKIYHSAVGCMPQARAKIDELVRYCSRDGEDVSFRYQMNNAVTYQLGIVDSILKTLSRIFFFIGIFFALFASLLMANFISTSISYKRQEIGILRAIGSRSNDVFRIFFSESFIIAMINFVISSVLCCIGTLIINYVIRTSLSVYVTVLHFGIRQILLLLFISIAVAFLSSFIPVRKIASKKPIDAIRGR